MTRETITTGRHVGLISSLPKWASAEIHRLDREVAALRDKLYSAVGYDIDNNEFVVPLKTRIRSAHEVSSFDRLYLDLGVTLKTPQQLHHERHVDCGHPDCNPGRALVKVKINVDARPARPAEHIWEEAWNDLLSSIALTRAHGSRTGTSETLIEGRGRQAFRFTRTSSNCQACAFSGVGACDDAPHTFYYIEELA